MRFPTVRGLLSRSRRGLGLGCGLSRPVAPPGALGRWVGIAMLSVVTIGPAWHMEPADAGPWDQTGSTPALDTGRLTAEYHQDFRGGKFDNKTLRLVGGRAEELVTAERDGLRIRMPAGRKNPAAVGVVPRFRIRGDFEITATFTILAADNPIRGYGVAATLWAETDTLTEEAVTIERGIIPNEGERFTSTRISGPQENRKYDVRRARAKSRSGKIRMERVGSMVTTSYADGDQPFRKLRTVELGPEELALVRAAAETGVSDHAVDVQFEELTIRAQALPGYVAAKP
jgi:Protein of unknown function (DUF1583)